MDMKSIEQKWQAKWEKSKLNVFHSDLRKFWENPVQIKNRIIQTNTKNQYPVYMSIPLFSFFVNMASRY